MKTTTTNQDNFSLWTRPGWMAEAEVWIHMQLARQGITIAGPIVEVHALPWSLVLRVPTDGGDVYFKATAPAFGHETAVTLALVERRPDCILPVIAADPARDWMILPDGGATLRSVATSAGDIDHWRRILPLYAGLQRDMVDQAQDLLALGIFDRRLATLPDQYEALLADEAALSIGREEGLSAGQVQILRDLVPQFTAMCRRLAAFGLPETVQHDDFHDANIFVQNGRYLFFDWGDACLAHPFFTLVVTLRVVAYRFELADDDPAVTQLRDLYLAQWQDYGDEAVLLEAFYLADRIGRVGRALTWHLVSHFPEYAEGVPRWLSLFLDSFDVTGA